MSDIETYVQRAKRLKLDPTTACIACGSESVVRRPSGGHKFCKRHTDWERAAVIYCPDCEYEVGLVCGVDE